MSNGIGHGIASGLTNALSLALQSKSLDIRSERNEALIDQGERRIALDEAQEAATFRPSVSQQEEAFNIEQGKNKAIQEQEILKRNQAFEADRKSKSYLSLTEHLDARIGDSRAPDQEGAFGDFLDAMIGIGKQRDGRYSEAAVDEAFKRAFDPDNPAPGGAELMKKYFQAGITQVDNKVEARKPELQKMMEKNPLLATNPEALKADEKASILAQEIQELEAMSRQFKSQAAETDEFIIQAEDREQEKQNELNRRRVEAIETIQAARATQAVERGQIGKVKVADFTLESLARFEQTGKFEDLERVVETPEAAKFQRQIEILNQQADAQGVGQVSSLTREAILSATGFTAGSFKFLAKAFGSFIPGEQFPKTQAAINDINLGNQQIIAGIALSNKFPIKEVERIQKFLVTGGAFFSDPPFALRQYLALRNDFELKNKGMLDAINSGATTEDQTQEFLEKIVVNNIALRLIPSRELLQSPKIFNEEQQDRKVTEELDFINSMTVEDIDSLTEEDVRALSPEAQDALINKLQTENISGRGVSGGF